MIDEQDDFDPQSSPEDEHHYAGPSGLPMLIGPDNQVRCLGSLKAQYGRPEQDSEAALDGTRGHALLQDTLNSVLSALAVGDDPPVAHDYVGAEYLGVSVDDARADEVQTIVDYIDEQGWLTRDGVNVYVEQRVTMDSILPGMFGRLDFAAIDFALGEINILDAKFGRHDVSPINHPPTKAYAIGLLEQLGDDAAGLESVRLVIAQPESGGIKEWWTSVDELYDWRDNILRPVLKLAHRPDAPRTPGYEQCCYCKAAGSCRELAETSLGLVLAQLRPLDVLRDPDAYPARRNIPDLTLEEKGLLRAEIKLVEAWTEAIKNEVTALDAEGVVVPFMKRVQGRKGNRTFRDEEAVISLLTQRRIDRGLWIKESLRTPTQILAKKKQLPADLVSELEQEHVYQADAKPMLVPVSDPRPALSGVADVDDFEVNS